MLNKWLAAGRLMLKDMDLEDMAALKFCLLSLGVLGGISIPAKGRKPAALLASFLFVGTYLPLMTKFLGSLVKTEEDGHEKMV